MADVTLPGGRRSMPARTVPWGLVLVAVATGASIGVGAGLGLSQTILIAAVLGPFVFLLTFARPQWITPVYIVVIYTNLLSVLTTFHGLPPLARFAGAALLTAVLGYRVIIRRERLTGDEMTWWMLLYAVMLAAGVLYARDSSRVVTNVIEFVRNFITYLIVLNTVTTTHRLRRILWVLLATGVILSLFTIFQSFTGRWDLDFGGLAQSKVSEIFAGENAPRPGGTLNDANYYGLSLLILVPLGMYLAWEGRSRAARLAGIGAVLILALTIILTYSRGDAIALVVVLAAAALYKRVPLTYIVGIILGLVLLTPFLPPKYLDRLGTVILTAQGDQSAIYNEASLRGRAGAIDAGIAMFLDHPLIGVGRENYVLYELEYVSGTSFASTAQGIPPHDFYLEIATEHGIMGLLVWGGLLLVVVRAVLEARRRFLAAGDRPHAELASWLGIALLGFLAGSLFLQAAYIYLLWLLITFIIVLRQLARTAPIPPTDATAQPAAR